MPRFEHGYKRAISEVVGGVVTYIVLNALMSVGLIPLSYLLSFKLLSLIGLIGLI